MELRSWEPSSPAALAAARAALSGLLAPVLKDSLSSCPVGESGPGKGLAAAAAVSAAAQAAAWLFCCCCGSARAAAAACACCCACWAAGRSEAAAAASSSSSLVALGILAESAGLVRSSRMTPARSASCRSPPACSSNSSGSTCGRAGRAGQQLLLPRCQPAGGCGGGLASQGRQGGHGRQGAPLRGSLAGSWAAWQPLR
jgi:hypothetical protein